MPDREPLLSFRPREQSGAAELHVLAGEPRAEAITPYLTGKFCEHLGSNIYNGMCAQILRNPAFADWPFACWGGLHPDGGHKRESDEEKIAAAIRGHDAGRFWPEEETPRVLESREDGLAHWWIRQGDRDAVRVSPDAGPHGGRAQRVEISAAGRGLAQWIYLPLHRVRRYEWRIVARSNCLTGLRIALTSEGGDA
ncbi:MAG: hypothetical protein ACYTGB_18120, partial [Planctomycetota bacterium]